MRNTIGLAMDGLIEMPQARVDVIIVNWNAGLQLLDCIQSFETVAQDDIVLGRIIVVDNGSNDGSVTRLDDDVKFPLKIVRNTDNRGFAAACNQGATGSTADFLLFLNPDTRLTAGSLEKPVAFFAAAGRESVGIVGIQLINATGKVARNCARRPTATALIGHSLGLDRLLPSYFPPHFLYEWQHDSTRVVDQVMGAFYMIRRPLFEALGGFDERFFVYFEDLDLALRSREHGWSSVYLTTAQAFHRGEGTTEVAKAQRLFYFCRSRILFAFKHFTRAAACGVAATTLLGEPLARTVAALLRGRAAEIPDIIRGIIMLWTALPNISRTTRNPSSMLRILVLTRYDRLGASSRVRFLQFLTPLAAHGISFSVRPFLDKEYIRRLYKGERAQVRKLIAAYLKRLRLLLFARGHDLVWVEKEALPWLPAALELALMRNVPYVVDFDDAWFHRYDQSSSLIVRGLMAGKIDAVIRHAAVVVAGNEYLAERARRAKARRVEIIPSVIDLNRYGTGFPSETNIHDTKKQIVIGWIGTPITVHYLVAVEHALRAIAAKHSVALHVVGASAPASFAGLPVKNMVWNEATEIQTIRGFDIGIMPLDNTLWEHGKCAYKLLQVMAAGRPVVASPIGANCTVIQDGINGFLADSPIMWIKALAALIENPALRWRMGAQALQSVKDRYTIDCVLLRLASVLADTARTVQ